MRPCFVLILAATLLGVRAGQAADEAKDKKPSASETTQAGWKVRSIHFTKAGPHVMLEALGTQERLQLSSGTTGDTRVLSAAFSAESGELVVEALVKGARVNITQKTSELDGEDYASSRTTRGPNAEDRKKYENLSERGREKFREQLREKFTDPAFRNAPEEERRAFVRDLFDKVAKEDKDTPRVPKDGKDASVPPGQKDRSEAALKMAAADNRKQYEALSEQQRDQFREQMRKTFADETFRNAPEEERRATVRAILEKIVNDDKDPR